MKNSKRVFILFAILLSGLFFVTKTTNAGTYISSSQREIIRDAKRLNDISVIKKGIESYYAKNHKYPVLNGKSNIDWYVNSTWGNQWTNFCNMIGISECPVDPINKINNCDCSLFGEGGCDDVLAFNSSTCYNSVKNTFVCPEGSYIYQYKSLDNGSDYSIEVKFEYSENISTQVMRVLIEHLFALVR